MTYPTFPPTKPVFAFVVVPIGSKTKRVLLRADGWRVLSNPYLTTESLRVVRTEPGGEGMRTYAREVESLDVDSIEFVREGEIASEVGGPGKVYVVNLIFAIDGVTATRVDSIFSSEAKARAWIDRRVREGLPFNGATLSTRDFYVEEFEVDA